MAFRTITEASEILEVPTHVLRFWEKKFESITPLKRGGGRRYYRPTDISLLYGIKHFLYYKKFSIRKTQNLLRKKEKREILRIGKEKYFNRSKILEEKSDTSLLHFRKTFAGNKVKVASYLNRFQDEITQHHKEKLFEIFKNLKNIKERMHSRLQD